MFKITLILLAGTIIASCGNNQIFRSVTGGAIGAGAAILVDGDPITGAVAGAGIGYATNPDQVTLGDAPIQGY